MNRRVVRRFVDRPSSDERAHNLAAKKALEQGRQKLYKGWTKVRETEKDLKQWRAALCDKENVLAVQQNAHQEYRHKAEELMKDARESSNQAYIAAENIFSRAWQRVQECVEEGLEDRLGGEVNAARDDAFRECKERAENRESEAVEYFLAVLRDQGMFSSIDWLAIEQLFLREFDRRLGYYGSVKPDPLEAPDDYF